MLVYVWLFFILFETFAFYVKVPPQEIRLNSALKELQIQQVRKKLVLSRLAYRTSLRYWQLVQLWILKESMAQIGLSCCGLRVMKETLVSFVSIHCAGTSLYDKLKAIHNAMLRINKFMDEVGDAASIIPGSEGRN